MSAPKKRRPGAARSEYLEVRMSLEEKERVVNAAERLGLTISDFVRLSILAQLGDETIRPRKK